MYANSCQIYEKKQYVPSFLYKYMKKSNERVKAGKFLSYSDYASFYVMLFLSPVCPSSERDISGLGVRKHTFYGKN